VPSPSEAADWLIVGLGNPGPEYEDTYHNVGFRVVDLLARRWDVILGIRMGPARVGLAVRGSRRVLIQPQTYMNLSGAVLSVLRDRFGEQARLLVISDDLALPLGRIRIRERGSAGGHNGLKSISSALGSEEYLRVRVGILPEGPPDGPDRGGYERMGDVRDYVLSRIRKGHRELIGRAEQAAADAVEDIVIPGSGETVREAMSKYNGLDLRSPGIPIQSERKTNG
jgi:peptidyl-tRNA hydrolase, PTH1 family